MLRHMPTISTRPCSHVERLQAFDSAPPRMRVPAFVAALHHDLFALDQQPATRELHELGVIQGRNDVRVVCPQRGQLRASPTSPSAEACLHRCTHGDRPAGCVGSGVSVEWINPEMPSPDDREPSTPLSALHRSQRLALITRIVQNCAFSCRRAVARHAFPRQHLPERPHSYAQPPSSFEASISRGWLPQAAPRSLPAVRRARFPA